MGAPLGGIFGENFLKKSFPQTPFKNFQKLSIILVI
jgi:hypothetical protein